MRKPLILIQLIFFLSIVTGCGSGAVIEEGPPLLIDDLGTVEMSYYDESGNEIAKLAMPNRVTSITKEGQSYFIRTETSEGSSVFEYSMEGEVMERQVFEKPFALTVLLNNSEGIALGYDLDGTTRTPMIVLSQDGEEAERIGIVPKRRTSDPDRLVWRLPQDNPPFAVIKEK